VIVGQIRQATGHEGLIVAKVLADGAGELIGVEPQLLQLRELGDPIRHRAGDLVERQVCAQRQNKSEI
jgi:hypothetical protein